MSTLKNLFARSLTVLVISSLLSAPAAMAETDLTAQAKYLKALADSHQDDHAIHISPTEHSQVFHGVFYGFVPCQDCPGIKTTLSLKQNNNYLLVTQYAMESSREFYEKGKYQWDNETHTVVLTPRKGATLRHYHIENEETLIQLDDNGARIVKEAERYLLRRSDTVKSREIHFH